MFPFLSSETVSNLSPVILNMSMTFLCKSHPLLNCGRITVAESTFKMGNIFVRPEELLFQKNTFYWFLDFKYCCECHSFTVVRRERIDLGQVLRDPGNNSECNKMLHVPFSKVKWTLKVQCKIFIGRKNRKNSKIMEILGWDRMKI